MHPKHCAPRRSLQTVQGKGQPGSAVLLNESCHFAEHFNERILFYPGAIECKFASAASIAREAGLAVAGTSEAGAVPDMYNLDPKE